MGKYVERDLRPGGDEAVRPLHILPWGAHRPNGLQRALIALTRATVLQRGNGRRLMSALICRFGRPLDITFRGCAFRVTCENNLIEYGLLTRPSYNGTEIDFLAEALKDPGAVFVDIGCNIGLYTLPLARIAGPAGRVLAVDANPDMVAHLVFHAAASDLSNVIAVAAAVGSERGQVDLKIRGGDLAIVAVVENEAGEIPMRPLAEIAASAGLRRVDALKIDIEGFEDAALAPYLRSASEAMLPRRIVIEKAGPDRDHPGCAAEFARLGYVLQDRTRNNSLYAREPASG
ncbi:MAG: FkbM family methyltransferase [Jannaschia sp.]